MSRWRRVTLTGKLEAALHGTKVFQRDVPDGFLEAFISIDDGDFHLSICHKTMQNLPGRYPTWDEIVDARYLFCPTNKTMAMLLPPPDEYVNIHSTTFHLWELRDTGIVEPGTGLGRPETPI